jgi:hypothetical protein
LGVKKIYDTHDVMVNLDPAAEDALKLPKILSRDTTMREIQPDLDWNLEVAYKDALTVFPLTPCPSERRKKFLTGMNFRLDG